MSEELVITQEQFDSFSSFTAVHKTQLQTAFGYFTTKTRYAIGISDPEKRKEIQDELDHAVGLLGVAHLMSLFEEHLHNNLWPTVIVDENEYNTLMAYRHIRHCAANGLTGKRPEDGKEYFDDIMGSDNPISGVIEFDDNRIILGESVAINAHTFIEGLMNKIIVELYNRLE